MKYIERQSVKHEINSVSWELVLWNTAYVGLAGHMMQECEQFELANTTVKTDMSTCMVKCQWQQAILSLEQLDRVQNIKQIDIQRGWNKMKNKNK